MKTGKNPTAAALATLGTLSLLLGGQIAAAAGDEQTRGQAATQASSQQGQQQGQAAVEAVTEAQTPVVEYGKLDTNDDLQVGWDEVKAAHGAALATTKWDKSLVMERYDFDSDGRFTPVEYQSFVAGLETRADEILAPMVKAVPEITGAPLSGDPEDIDPQVSIGEQQSAESQQQSSRQAATAGAGAASGAASSVSQLSADDLQGRTLMDSSGEAIGQVQDVVTRQGSSQPDLVVEVGGVMGIGSREVLIDADSVKLRDDELVWENPQGQALENLPVYDGEDVVSVR